MIGNNKILYFVVKILILYYWEEINQQISDPLGKQKQKKSNQKNCKERMNWWIVNNSTYTNNKKI